MLLCDVYFLYLKSLYPTEAPLMINECFVVIQRIENSLFKVFHSKRELYLASKEKNRQEELKDDVHVSMVILKYLCRVKTDIGNPFVESR